MEVASGFISHSSLPCESDMLPLHRDIDRVLVCHSAPGTGTWPLFKASWRKQTKYRCKTHSGLGIFSRGDLVHPSKTIHNGISSNGSWCDPFAKWKFSSPVSNLPADSSASNILQPAQQTVALWNPFCTLEKGQCRYHRKRWNNAHTHTQTHTHTLKVQAPERNLIIFPKKSTLLSEHIK